MAQGLSAVSVGSEYTAEELDFLQAMEAYKRLHRRRFPAWSEVLAVVRDLGYRKVAKRVPLATRVCPACGEATERERRGS